MISIAIWKYSRFAIRYFTELFIRASILSKSNFEFSYNALKIKILTILSLTVCGHHDKSEKSGFIALLLTHEFITLKVNSTSFVDNSSLLDRKSRIHLKRYEVPHNLHNQ